MWAGAVVAVAAQQRKRLILKYYSISGNLKYLKRGVSRDSPLLTPSRKPAPGGGEGGGATPVEARRSS